MKSALALQPRCRPDIVRIGNSREPVIVIDGVLTDPAALVAYAAGEADFAPASTGGGGYPGIRAAAPSHYTDLLVEAVQPLIGRVFGLRGMRRVRVDGSLSIVTMPREALHPMQRVPHIDTSNPLRFAFLHFLCGDHFGGTAFYRHEATGFEQISPHRLPAYQTARKLEREALPTPCGYPDSDTAGFSRTHAFAARWDRLLVYRSFSLHSGIISPEIPVHADPRTGRLTANIFVDYAAGEGAA